MPNSCVSTTLLPSKVTAPTAEQSHMTGTTSSSSGDETATASANVAIHSS
jgi:hypothetical protein